VEKDYQALKLNREYAMEIEEVDKGCLMIRMSVSG